MEKRITLLLVAIVLLLLLSAEQSSGSLFSSLEFTRESLMSFSRDSERTEKTVKKKVITEAKKARIDEEFERVIPSDMPRPLTPTTVVRSRFNRFWKPRNYIQRAPVSRDSERTEKTVMKKVVTEAKEARIDEEFEWVIHSDMPPPPATPATVVRSRFNRFGKRRNYIQRAAVSRDPGRTEKRVMKNVVIEAKKARIDEEFERVIPSDMPPPLTPTTVVTSRSNEFWKAMNDIQRAVVNANASDIRYSDATLARLKALVERALRSKSYKYARQVLGQIMYLLSTRPVPPGRRKRSSESEGSKFLQDLRQRVGSATFDSFLGVKGDVSLMFAIDTTGSMRDEIQAAKKIATDIINYPRKAPIREYILSPFNDPYPLPGVDDPVIAESEGRKFTEEINKLRAHDGGDCPEYTFEGMLGALNTFMIAGPMYVFTDAGPKDATPDNIKEVKEIAMRYGVTINFLVTGTCDTRGYSVGDPRNLHQAFLDLAKSTSGLAMLFRDYQELRQVSNLTSWVQEGSSVVSGGSAEKDRKKRSAVGAADSVYSIPVDDSIKKLSVTVCTSGHDSRGQGITLKDPADNVILTSEKLSLSRMTIYQLINPIRGIWTLTISQYSWHEFLAKSSSDANIDFEHFFLIPLLWRRRHTVEVPISNPVIGKLNKIIINVAGSEKVDNSSLRLQLITAEGSHIRDVALQQNIQDLFIANFTPPGLRQPFKLKLKGTTRGGYRFERISRQTIKSTTAILRGNYASNDFTLPLNRTTYIHFQLCNFGSDELFDVAVVKDTLRYILPARRRRPRRVKKNRCAVMSVYAKATRSQDVGKTDSVFVIVKGRSSRVAVSQTVNLLVNK